MSTVLEHSVEIAAPVETVFDYVEDHRTIEDWVVGLADLRPVTEQLSGLGSQYEGVIRAGIPLRARMECTAWEKDRLLEITSVKGVRSTQRWEFSELAPDRTRVSARLSYDLPGGLAGRAAGGAVRPAVGAAVRRSAAQLVRNVEALAA